MGFFVKKMDGDRVRDFFITAYKDILSTEEMESNKDKLKQASEALPLLKGVKQSDFDKHLTAVNLELLDISWAKYMTSKIGMDASVEYIMKVKPQIESGVPGLKKYDKLMGEYNKAFASRANDGFAGMAEYFISKIVPNIDEKYKSIPEEVDKTEAAIKDLFTGSYSVENSLVKGAGLIS